MQYKGIKINIIYKGKQCVIQADGDKEVVISVIRIIWELAFLYDGYFYKPKKYLEDKKEI